MVIDRANRKPLLDFLIQKWKTITGFAALERVYIASCLFAQSNNVQMPQPPVIMIPRPCLQIEIIKKYIIEILPEANFIDYRFEAQAMLTPEDFVEIFVADHNLCIDKVVEVIEKMQINCVEL